LRETVTRLGCRPYRLGIHSMAEIDIPDDYTAFLQRLKTAADPACILAEGRYQGVTRTATPA
jgi:hypothetical protein